MDDDDDPDAMLDLLRMLTKDQSGRWGSDGSWGG